MVTCILNLFFKALLKRYNRRQAIITILINTEHIKTLCVDKFQCHGNLNDSPANYVIRFFSD